MVIVQLIGGLGNQLFQYAFGKHMAKLNKTELVLDTSAFHDSYKLHKYSLQHFGISAKIADRHIVDEIKNYPKPNKWQKAIQVFLGTPFIVIKEKAFNFDEKVLKKYNSKHIFVDGYWQTEKYFESIKEILYKEFQITTPQGEQDKSISEKIRNSNAISLHIRRADYTNPETVEAHGMCSLEYYQNAVEEVASEVENPTFFVFSDDIEWAEQHLKIAYPIIFVGHNDAEKNYEDLRLMSECQHNIIANSSFSWWGAWLNPNPNKIVVAPTQWFNPDSAWCKEMNINQTDIIPNDWLRIDNY